MRIIDELMLDFNPNSKLDLSEPMTLTDIAINVIEKWKHKYPGLAREVYQVKYLRHKNGLIIGDLAKMSDKSASWWSSFERGGSYNDKTVKTVLEKLEVIDREFSNLMDRKRSAEAGIHLPMSETDTR